VREIGYQMVTDMPKPDVYRAIADPTRRAILDRLRGGALPVHSLAEDFRQTRPAISRHLRVLREARLVQEQVSGRQRLYSLKADQLQKVAGWIEGYRGFWQVSLDKLKRHLESGK
jgi:DNA-binding transcriptional ArsR family regulator